MSPESQGDDSCLGVLFGAAPSPPQSPTSSAAASIEEGLEDEFAADLLKAQAPEELTAEALAADLATIRAAQAYEEQAERLHGLAQDLTATPQRPKRVASSRTGPKPPRPAKPELKEEVHQVKSLALLCRKAVERRACAFRATPGLGPRLLDLYHGEDCNGKPFRDVASLRSMLKGAQPDELAALPCGALAAAVPELAQLPHWPGSEARCSDVTATVAARYGSAAAAPRAANFAQGQKRPATDLPGSKRAA